MDFNAIIQAIGSLGFPIVACSACFWMINKQDERHREEMKNITDALNNNTNAISSLTENLRK